jgi:hypothetical protein
LSVFVIVFALVDKARIKLTKLKNVFIKVLVPLIAVKVI